MLDPVHAKVENYYTSSFILLRSNALLIRYFTSFICYTHIFLFCNMVTIILFQNGDHNHVF